MTKKAASIILIISIIGYGFFSFLCNGLSMDWGHHFTFENDLGCEIDSLEITVGNVKTVIQANSDGSESLEGNISVPKNGYPHAVTFKIYHNEKLIKMNADSFDCYNCDGSHEYRLKVSGAAYRFLN